MMQSGTIKKKVFDWYLFYFVIALVIIGSIAIISSTYMLPAQSRIIRTHFIALFIGIAFMSFFGILNYQIFNDQWKYIYALSIIVLAGLFIFGSVEKGARSWYRLTFFSIQPSEFARIGLILTMSSFLERNLNRISEFFYLFLGLLITFPFMFLMLKQPDFSGILITIPVIFSMFYVAGASSFHVSIFLSYVFLSSLFPLLWTAIVLNPSLSDNFFISIFFELADLGWNTLIFIILIAFLSFATWKVLNYFKRISGFYFAGFAVVLIAGFLTGVFIKHQIKSYQYKRVQVFLDPAKDPKGAGYNLLQARIAIGSGGFTGKGIFSGTQSRLGFVPERHTDFILSVVGEELGFVGIFLVMGLYAIIMYRIKTISDLARDNYGYFICVGFFSLFFSYFLINFGMILGFLPVAGVPLPLLSYGGSNMVSIFIIIGLLQSVYSRRYSIT